MKPNILFFVIDSLRADRFTGKNRTCKTPTIDSILDSGTYFNNVYSSSDVTGPCLGNFFTGMYPYKSKMTMQSFNKNVINFFDLLKKSNEYLLFSNIPDFTWMNNLTKKFDEKKTFFCGGLKQDGLNDGIGDNIIQQITKNYSKPWFYYVHIHDLHDEIIVPEKFNNEEFGTTKYDKQVSFIDSWINKILEKINLENTIVIILADHASYIRKENMGQMPNVQKYMKKIKEKSPLLEPIGLKIFKILRNLLIFIQKENSKKKLNFKEMRAFTKKGGVELFDDVLHIPLFFIGKEIPSNLKINQLVSGADLFPTLLKLTGINYKNSKIDGIDLHEFMKNLPEKDRCIYIESGGNIWNEEGKVAGIRTRKYKYLRSKKDIKKYVSLYDVSKDPSETNNIANESPDIIKHLESILQLMLKRKIDEKEKIKKIIFKNNEF